MYVQRVGCTEAHTHKIALPDADNPIFNAQLSVTKIDENVACVTHCHESQSRRGRKL